MKWNVNCSAGCAQENLPRSATSTTSLLTTTSLVLSFDATSWPTLANNIRVSTFRSVWYGDSLGNGPSFQECRGHSNLKTFPRFQAFVKKSCKNERQYRPIVMYLVLSAAAKTLLGVQRLDNFRNVTGWKERVILGTQAGPTFTSLGPCV